MLKKFFLTSGSFQTNGPWFTCVLGIVISVYYFFLTESTLHMLGRNEIQEAIHRTSDPEKFETDLITALSHFIRQTHHTCKCQKYFAFISVWPVSPHMTILQEVVA